jgi:nicotinamidase-related amidase
MVHDQLLDWRRTSVLICGVEAHVCVLQTVLDLQASGRQAFVCTDAVSASQHEQIQPAYQRMTRAGASLTGVLSAMYELMEDSTHPSFRACLELAKAVEQ